MSENFFPDTRCTIENGTINDKDEIIIPITADTAGSLAISIALC